MEVKIKNVLYCAACAFMSCLSVLVLTGAWALFTVVYNDADIAERNNAHIVQKIVMPEYNYLNYQQDN